jgi:hypothetical protein
MAESTRIDDDTSESANQSQESVLQAGILSHPEPPSKKLKVKMSFNSSRK